MFAWGKKKPWLPALVGAVCSLLALLAYAATLSPTVNFVDSGEFITVAATGGVAHAPGYPLYTLLIAGAAALPVGEVAVRVNAVSALLGAAAVAAFYALSYEVLRHHLPTSRPMPASPPPPRSGSRRKRGAPLSAPTPAASERPASLGSSGAAVVSAGVALTLGFGFIFWEWATQAKMYTLHFLLVALIFLFALCARRATAEAAQAEPGARFTISRGPGRALVTLAFVTGLAFTNHYTTAYLLPGLAVLLLWPLPSSPGGKVQAQPWRWLLRYAPVLAPAGLVPLSLYLYLPLRSAQHPPIDWGIVSNSWPDLWRHLTMWQFRDYVGSLGPPWSFLDVAWGYALDQYGAPVGALIALAAIVGVARLARSNTPLLVGTLLAALGALYNALNYPIENVTGYWVPLYMMVLLWAGVGLYWGLERLSVRARGWRVGALAAPLALALLAFMSNAGRGGQRANYIAEDYVRNSFAAFAPGAVVITSNYDLVTPSYYLQHVLGERRDVAIIHKDSARYPWYIDYMERQFPDLMGLVAPEKVRYVQVERAWVEGRPYDPGELGAAYIGFFRAIIERSIQAGRPVYLHWTDNPGPEERAIMKGLNAHPVGLALQVGREPYAGPPQVIDFKLRGILTEKVPIDELSFRAAAGYATAYDRQAAYWRARGFVAEAERATTLAGQVRDALGIIR